MMERLTKYVTPVGMVMTSLNSMKHYMPCVPCRHRAEIKYKDDKGYTEEFSFCGTCEVKMLFNKLKEYENLEEQGLLLRLPCGIGADVYFIPSKTNYKLNILQGYPESNRVYHQNVEKISFTQYGWYLECDKDIEYETDHILVDKLYKETWFLTQEEAEHKLKEMESD